MKRNLTLTERLRRGLRRRSRYLNYAETAVVFREVPDHATLASDIPGCPHCGPGCHSPHLQGGGGRILDENEINNIINHTAGITCVALMGGDGNTGATVRMLRYLKKAFPMLKTCWYSGGTVRECRKALPYLDYLKCGKYVRELGPLDSPATNQRFYCVNHTGKGTEIVDRTDLFRRG